MDMIGEVEKTLIGEIINEPKIFNEVVRELRATDFRSDMAKCTYYALVKMYEQGKIGDSLDMLELLHSCGGSEEYRVYLFEASRDVISPNYQVHMKMIREESILRSVRTACHGIALDSLSDITEMEQQVADVLKSFEKRDRARVYNVDDLYERFMKRMSEEPHYIKTGLITLDKKVLISKGDYIIVGGRPSTGKTALTAQMALEMAREHKVMYFSLETNCDKLWDRIIANGCNIPMRSIQDRSFTNDHQQMKTVADFYTSIRGNGLEVVEAAGYTLNDIRSAAIQGGAEIIFIDYLTLINDKGKTMLDKATNISMGLHTLAQSLQITVVALSQLNRDSTNRETPAMTDLRESGQIEQDADAILLISKNKGFEDVDIRRVELSVVKNKEGTLGRVPLIFYGDYQRFIIDENPPVEVAEPKKKPKKRWEYA